MEFHLINGTDDLHFPVPFSDFEITQSSLSEKIILLNYGEINNAGGKALREVSLSGMFPHIKYPFCQTTPKEPVEYINTIQKFKDDKVICRFIIIGTSVNFEVNIEEFTYGMKTGKDYYFNLNLREYRPLR